MHRRDMRDRLVRNKHALQCGGVVRLVLGRGQRDHMAAVAAPHPHQALAIRAIHQHQQASIRRNQGAKHCLDHEVPLPWSGT